VEFLHKTRKNNAIFIVIIITITAIIIIIIIISIIIIIVIGNNQIIMTLDKSLQRHFTESRMCCRYNARIANTISFSGMIVAYSH